MIWSAYRKIQNMRYPVKRESHVHGTGALSVLTFVIALVAPNHAFSLQNLPDINVGKNSKKKIIERRLSGSASGATGNTGQRGDGASSPSSAGFSNWSATLPDGKPAFVEKFQLPNSVSSITRQKIEEKINVIDSEDAVRYMPSLAVRKRYNGDTQAPLMTRTWGYNSPARSLVYVDDLLISNLISNETLTGAPRWGLVTPEEIERVDFLYGPYSAQYAGNSMGGVLQYTTRMPDKLTVSARNNTAVQDFSLYGTNRGFTTNVANFYLGDRINDFAWSLAGNWLHGSQIPQYYVTELPNNLYPYPGAYYAVNRFGLPATVVGTAGALTNDQVTGKFRATYDITKNIKASYTLGLWTNDGTSIPQNFTTPGNIPYFGRQPLPTPPWLGPSALLTFGSGYYRVQEKMLTNAGSVKSNSGGVFDFELSASNFSILQFDQVSPFSGAYPYGGYTSTGRDLRFGGTYWTLLDLKGIVRPDHEAFKDHNISFGLHGDQVHANNPVYMTASWPSGMGSAYGVPASISSGTTRTQALWFQDAWKFEENSKFTVGVDFH